MKKLAFLLSVLLLLTTAFLGISNGIRERDDALSGLQQSVWFAVSLYGVLGLLGAVGLIRRRPWTVTVTTAWAIACTYAGTVASFAYSDPTFSQQGTLAGVIGAFVGGALIGAFVVWTARSATRVPQSAEHTHIPPS